MNNVGDTVIVWIALKLHQRFGEAAFSFFSFFFFFFSRVFGGMRLLFNEQYMNSSRKCWLFPVNSASVHRLWTHKFHFLATFSLKMGFTELFTHLKIILLQCFQFSVFSFSKIVLSKHTHNFSHLAMWQVVE